MHKAYIVLINTYCIVQIGTSGKRAIVTKKSFIT